MIGCSPQAAGGVAQQQRGLELDFVFVAVGEAAPARVGDDHGVGERAQSVADDRHLHRVTRGEVPQHALGGGDDNNRNDYHQNIVKEVIVQIGPFQNNIYDVL